MDQRQREGYVSRGSQYYRTVPAQKAPVTPPIPQANRVLRTTKKQSWRTWVIGGLVVAGLLVAAALLLVNNNRSPLPAPIARQITFPAYLPDKSRGVIVDQNSYAWQEGVLTYKVQTPDNNQVFVSEQVVPKNFDLTSFLQRIKNKQTLTNQYGQGQAGISENNLIISQIVNDNWIFMSGPTTMDPAQLGQVFQSLHKY
ncbi:hypothetical protein H7Y63_03565 [Polaromonas sp.]|nr:hypothetical protein [Candidatus Saccharibacteria bacterium]